MGHRHSAFIDVRVIDKSGRVEVGPAQPSVEAAKRWAEERLRTTGQSASIATDDGVIEWTTKRPGWRRQEQR